MFTQHQEEIKRRGDVLRMQESINPGVFEFAKDDEGSDFPFVTEGQDWVLFSVSHRAMPPVALDATDPAVRIYGVFETTDEAVAHAKQIQGVDASVNLQMAKTREWIVARSSPDRIDPELDAAHVAAVLEAYQDTRTRNTAEFKENVREAKGVGPVIEDITDEATASDGPATAPTVDTSAMRSASALPRSAEVRGQTLAVVSFVADVQHAECPEFLFKVYACFDAQKDADRYVRNTASHEVRDFDMDVVSLCEWLHAQKVSGSKLKSEVFRAPELNSIISNHKSQPQQVASFERWRNSDA